MKNFKNLGKTLTKNEQKTIIGSGGICCEWGPGHVIMPGGASIFHNGGVHMNSDDNLGGTFFGTVCVDPGVRGECPFTAA